MKALPQTWPDIWSIPAYHELALRTEKPLPSTNLRLMHAWLGMVTENGEFTTEVKRHVIYEKPLTEEMVLHMLEELGDWCWYAAILFDALEVKFDTDETYLPPHWARKTLGDKLLYCAAHLENSANQLMRTLNLATLPQNGPGSENRQALIRDQLRTTYQSVAAVEWTARSLLNEGLGEDDGPALARLLQANINKLRERFPDKYSNKAAEARADKAGLSARES